MKYKRNTFWSFGVSDTGEIIFCETFIPDITNIQSNNAPKTINLIGFKPKIKLLEFMKNYLIK